MSQEFLLGIYITALVVQVILLFRAWKSERILLWMGLYVFEVCSVTTALATLRYYNEHPGYMLSTMGHVLFSLGASGVFCLMVLITIIVHILRATAFQYH